MAPIIINLAPDGIDWSAWLQAGGAVAGIFLAVLLPYWQRHSEKLVVLNVGCRACLAGTQQD